VPSTAGKSVCFSAQWYVMYVRAASEDFAIAEDLTVYGEVALAPEGALRLERAGISITAQGTGKRIAYSSGRWGEESHLHFQCHCYCHSRSHSQSQSNFQFHSHSYSFSPDNITLAGSLVIALTNSVYPNQPLAIFHGSSIVGSFASIELDRSYAQEQDLCSTEEARSFSCVIRVT
jgi:hypothetical protein